MICPECRTEYRAGFARCADCGAELVEVGSGSLVETRSPEAQGGTPDQNEQDPFCEFWRGDDPRLQGELCQVLEEAGIPVRTLQLDDVLRRIGIPSALAAFRVGIPFSQFEKGEKAIAEAFGDSELVSRTLWPTEQNSPELRKLIDRPLREKLERVPREDVPTFWDQVTWKRKRGSTGTAGEESRPQPGKDASRAVRREENDREGR